MLHEKMKKTSLSSWWAYLLWGQSAIDNNGKNHPVHSWVEMQRLLYLPISILPFSVTHLFHLYSALDLAVVIRNCTGLSGQETSGKNYILDSFFQHAYINNMIFTINSFTGFPQVLGFFLTGENSSNLKSLFCSWYIPDC